MPQDPFAELGRKRRPWWIAVVIAVAVLALGAGVYAKRRGRKAPQRYLTEEVTRGDVEETVEATGTVQPLLQVQVGSQVSGRLTEVNVDFNSRVRQGQLLARIDPTPFRAAEAQARAALATSRAQLLHARANEALTRTLLARDNALLAQHLVAPVDVDTARGQHDMASADVTSAVADVARTTANLASAETNLAYTRILAPIDGVVIQRSVNPGQTVAASFQAPVLFIIANDLTRMQILANIDEADVGKLHEHMVANARVDAFPGDTFRGAVTQVRFGSVTNAGVVTYPAVVEVANPVVVTAGVPSVKLRPGMTATVTVITQHDAAVLRVPNAALRYRPGTGRPNGAPGQRQPRAPAAGPGRQGVLFVLRGTEAARVPVQVGISDGFVTEVQAPGLHPGDRVVIDETDAAASGPGGVAGGPGGGRQGQRRLF